MEPYDTPGEDTEPIEYEAPRILEQVDHRSAPRGHQRLEGAPRLADVRQTERRPDFDSKQSWATPATIDASASTWGGTSIVTCSPPTSRTTRLGISWPHLRNASLPST